MKGLLTKLSVAALCVLLCTMLLKGVFYASEESCFQSVTIDEKIYTQISSTTLFGYYMTDVEIEDIESGDTLRVKNARIDIETGVSTNVLAGIWSNENPFLYLIYFSNSDIFENESERRQ